MSISESAPVVTPHPDGEKLAYNELKALARRAYFSANIEKDATKKILLFRLAVDCDCLAAMSPLFSASSSDMALAS